MTQPAAPEKPAETPPEAPVAPQEPKTDLTRGWEAESYAWPADDGETPPPASKESTPPPPESRKAPESQAQSAPPESAPATPDATQTLETIVSRDLSDAEVETLLQNKALKERVDRLAANRFGNLKAEEERRQAAARQAEEQWAEAEGFYQHIQTLHDTDRARYDELIRDPEVKIWLGEFERAAEQRRRPAAAAVDVDRVTTEALTKALPEWNVEAAKAFAAIVQKETPFYRELPADLRRDLEAGTQADQTKSWAEEYTQRLTKGFMSWHESEIAAAREAGRNEARAEAGGASPVIVSSPAAGDLTAAQILQRHMDYGFDPDRGVTEEQYARAKKQQGWDW